MNSNQSWGLTTSFASILHRQDKNWYYQKAYQHLYICITQFLWITALRWWKQNHSFLLFKNMSDEERETSERVSGMTKNWRLQCLANKCCVYKVWRIGIHVQQHKFSSFLAIISLPPLSCGDNRQELITLSSDKAVGINQFLIVQWIDHDG